MHSMRVISEEVIPQLHNHIEEHQRISFHALFSFLPWLLDVVVDTNDLLPLCTTTTTTTTKKQCLCYIDSKGSKLSPIQPFVKLSRRVLNGVLLEYYKRRMICGMASCLFFRSLPTRHKGYFSFAWLKFFLLGCVV